MILNPFDRLDFARGLDSLVRKATLNPPLSPKPRYTNRTEGPDTLNIPRP